MSLDQFLFIFDYDKSYPKPGSISPDRWLAMWKFCETHYEKDTGIDNGNDGPDSSS